MTPAHCHLPKLILIVSLTRAVLLLPHFQLRLSGLPYEVILSRLALYLNDRGRHSDAEVLRFFVVINLIADVEVDPALVLPHGEGVLAGLLVLIACHTVFNALAEASACADL